MIHRAPLSRKASTQSLQSLYSQRRSSASCADLQRIQDTFKRKRTFSNQFLTILLVLSCPLLFAYHYIIFNFNGSIKETLRVFLFTEYTIDVPLNMVAFVFPLFLVCGHLVMVVILPVEDMVILEMDGTFKQRKLNSFTCSFLFTLFYILGSGLNLYDGGCVFENWLQISTVISIIIIVSLLLTIGRTARAYNDSNTILSDLYFGIDLTPQFLDIDIKKFITHHLSTSIWLIYIVSAILHAKKTQKQISDTLIGVCLLQIVYIFKFLWNEHFFYSNLDAQNDKAGFYRIWGVLVFMPTIYTTPITLAAKVSKGGNVFFYNMTILTVGLMAQWITAAIDRQKYNFRLSQGRCKIWGYDPFFIVAKSRKENGDIHTSLILGSGFWGISRRLNYSMEWISIVTWTLMSGSSTLLALFPVLFITIFLIGRGLRDEQRLLQKYGNYWVQYCQRVPFIFMPGVY
uniref:7-dehydrocholesterol reductase n=1 Tax=Rhabditophanes sp. KR3021 TaxID=114890 RepID=A0AC35UFG6_9BILA